MQHSISPELHDRVVAELVAARKLKFSHMTQERLDKYAKDVLKDLLPMCKTHLLELHQSKEATLSLFTTVSLSNEIAYAVMEEMLNQ